MAGSRGIEVDVAALDGFSRQVTQLCIDGCLRSKEATDGPFRPVDATSRQSPKRRLLGAGGIEGHTGKIHQASDASDTSHSLAPQPRAHTSLYKKAVEVDF